jgi:hypothetical protein
MHNSILSCQHSVKTSHKQNQRFSSFSMPFTRLSWRRQNAKTLSLADRVGIALSGLCAVHCLVLPFIVPFVGFFAALAESEWTHVFLAIGIVPTVVFASARGYRRHGKREILWLLGAGALAVIMALGVRELAGDDRLEAAFTTCGSALLIAGHWKNHRHCSLCADEKSHVH